ncbi:hypothetical protein ABKV19_004502 [Rosa sericea]
MSSTATTIIFPLLTRRRHFRIPIPSPTGNQQRSSPTTTIRKLGIAIPESKLAPRLPLLPSPIPPSPSKRKISASTSVEQPVARSASMPQSTSNEFATRSNRIQSQTHNPDQICFCL